VRLDASSGVLFSTSRLKDVAFGCGLAGRAVRYAARALNLYGYAAGGGRLFCAISFLLPNGDFFALFSFERQSFRQLDSLPPFDP